MCDIPGAKTGVAWQGWSDLPAKPPRQAVGEWIDLTYALSPSVPRSAMFGPPKFTRIAEMPEKPANITHMDMVVHTGTHVDAPLHFCAGAPGTMKARQISAAPKRTLAPFPSKIATALRPEYWCVP